MSRTPTSLPAHHVDHHAYRDARVSFAVDVSGSTAGSILRAESSFVQRCASLLSQDACEHARVLPWNHTAQLPRPISRLGTLTAGGYTVPGAIMEDPVCRTTLKSSSLWFLLTDGLIDEEHRLRLADQISKQGLHGTSCITAIFGSAGQRGPSSCNISVGISVFAVVPNCVFLFNDISSGEVYILQCKGIFNYLLMGQENPIIDEDTPWSILPRLSIPQLGRLIVPPPKELSSDEIALQDDLVINFEALWTEKLSKDQVSRILDNDDSLKSIMQTAQTRGQSRMFQNWVQKQEIKAEDPLYKPRNDVGGNAGRLFKTIISLLQNGASSANPQLKQLQARLRRAYSSNMSELLGTARKSQQESVTRTSRIQSSSSRSSSDIHSASSLSPVVFRSSVPQTAPLAHNSAPLPGVASYTPPRVRPEHREAPPAPYRATHAGEPAHRLRPMQRDLPVGPYPNPLPPFQPPPSYSALYAQPESPKWESQWESSGLLYTPGFRRTSSDASFSGSCSICGSGRAVLAWLFHSAPANLSTQAFPAPNSASILAFPLAMGNFPETDVLSSTICCEACSSFCSLYRTSPQSEYVTAALPMVSYRANSAAWQNVLALCFESRFAKEHLAQLFLGVILTGSEMMPSAPVPHDTATQLFRDTATWATKNILGESTEVMELSASFSQPSPGSTLPRELSTVLAENFKKVYEPRAPLLLYPLEGFKIIFKAIEVADPTGALVAFKHRQLVMYRRLLHLLVEQYVLGGGAGSTPVNDPPNLSSFLSTLLWTHEKSSWERMERPQSASSPQMEEDGDFVLAEAPPAHTQQRQPFSRPASSITTPRCSISVSQLRNSPLLSEPLYRTLSQIGEFRQLEQNPSVASLFGPPTALFLHAVNKVTSDGGPGNAAVDPHHHFEKLMNLRELAILSIDPTEVTEQIVMREFGEKKQSGGNEELGNEAGK